jgi:hypothetical protein
LDIVENFNGPSPNRADSLLIGPYPSVLHELEALPAHTAVTIQGQKPKPSSQTLPTLRPVAQAQSESTGDTQSLTNMPPNAHHRLTSSSQIVSFVLVHREVN